MLNRRLISLCATLFAAVGALVLIPTNARAQARLTNCEEVKLSTDSLRLSNRAGELTLENKKVNEEISNLRNELPDALTPSQLDTMKKNLDKLRQKPNRTEDEERSATVLENAIKNARTAGEIKKEISEKEQKVAENADLSFCVQARLYQLSSPDFKQSISTTFALLIGAVIIGFFILAFIDETMRRAIFSGETGIQFLTLFSVVIAIILFGITGILHDKELAALLGGLSGYILGRTSRQAPPATPPAAAGPQKDVAALQQFIKDLDSIKIAPTTASLSPTSKTQKLTAEARDINGSVIKGVEEFFVPIWESRDTKVAKVDQSGLVSRVATGKCTVTASFGNIQADDCEVTCTDG